MCPKDLLGRVIDGAPLPHKPAPPLDTSNGWFANHPLVKVRKYCEHLDAMANAEEPDPSASGTGDGVGLEDGAVGAPTARSASEEEAPFTKEMVAEIIEREGANITKKRVRESLEAQLELPSGELEAHKAAIKAMMAEAIFGPELDQA